MKSLLQLETVQIFVATLLTLQVSASGLYLIILILILLQTFDSSYLCLYITVQLPLTVSFTLMVLEMFNVIVASCANAKALSLEKVISCAKLQVLIQTFTFRKH